MKTEKIAPSELARAAQLLQQEEVVAFPTETVYGLGASIFSEEGIKKIFSVKGRPSDNPLIAHISEINDVLHIARDVPDLFYTLANTFFPGPLTIVLPKQPSVPFIASAGLESIAVRMPNHPIARELIRLVGAPLVAPSANISGKPSSTCVGHVLEDFEGKIAGVVLGEPCEFGIESTVVSLLNGRVEILRPGVISLEEIEACVGKKVHYHGELKEGSAAASPGMKYKHYAPQAKVIVLSNLDQALQGGLEEIMILSVKKALHKAWYPLASYSLYDRLRLADKMGISEVRIVCDEETQKNKGLMDRIEKASS